MSYVPARRFRGLWRESRELSECVRCGAVELVSLMEMLGGFRKYQHRGPCPRNAEEEVELEVESDPRIDRGRQSLGRAFFSDGEDLRDWDLMRDDHDG